MGFNIFETDRYCVRKKHRSAATKIVGDITSKRSKVLIGKCLICKRRKSMIFSDNTKQAEGLDFFFKI